MKLYLYIVHLHLHFYTKKKKLIPEQKLCPKNEKKYFAQIINVIKKLVQTNLFRKFLSKFKVCCYKTLVQKKNQV